MLVHPRLLPTAPGLPAFLLVDPGPGMREHAVESELVLGDPAPQPHDTLQDGEEDGYAHGDAEDVGGDQGPLQAGVEEGVGVEPLGRARDVGQGEVQGEQQQQEGQVRPGGGVRARQDDLDEGEDAVEGVLGDVAPGRERRAQRRRQGQQAPEDDDDEQGEGRDGGVEERVQGLQGPGPVVEGRAAVARVEEGVQGREEQVEGQPVVGEHGEVGEAVARRLAAALGGVRAVVADVEEYGREGVEGLRASRHVIVVVSAG